MTAAYIGIVDWPMDLRFALLGNLPDGCGWNYIEGGITVMLPRDHFSMRQVWTRAWWEQQKQAIRAKINTQLGIH